MSKNGLSGTSLEQCKVTVASAVRERNAEESASALSSNPAHTKTVTVGTGRLVVRFEGNLFELDTEERDKLNELIELVQAFR